MNPEDICARLGDDYEKSRGAVSPPIYQTSLFTRKHGDGEYSYTRVANPTTEVAEKKIAALEKGEAARCFSSGMAAITSSILHFVKAGSHVVAPINIYLPTRFFLFDYLARFGVTATFVDGDDPSDFEKAAKPETTLFYLESPSSNIFSMQDLAAISEIARSKNIVTAIDNSWATPLFQNPLCMGVDLVIHSASKYLGGHSDIIGGVIAGNETLVADIANKQRSVLGSIMDPHLSWLLIRSLRTLPARMKQHQESGLMVARFLENHRKVKRVLYPGLESHPQYSLGMRQMTGSTGLLGFVPDGSEKEIRKFITRLQHFEIGPSWGGHESLLNSPGLGISDEDSRSLRIPRGLIRLSIGLESPDTLIEDLDRGLALL